jgi:hypothetical protein
MLWDDSAPAPMGRGMEEFGLGEQDRETTIKYVFCLKNY